MRSGSFLNIYLVQKYNSHTIIYSFSLLQNWKICAMCKTNLICHKIKFPAHLVVVTQASKHRSERMDRWTDGLMDRWTADISGYSPNNPKICANRMRFANAFWWWRRERQLEFCFGNFLVVRCSMMLNYGQKYYEQINQF